MDCHRDLIKNKMVMTNQGSLDSKIMMMRRKKSHHDAICYAIVWERPVENNSTNQLEWVAEVLGSQTTLTTRWIWILKKNEESNTNV